jgi:ferredoxin--NADP+ reductase
VTGLPFDDARGLIPNEEGRVVGREREYVTGWIKRGPSGIIGTNKRCAQATVQQLLADLGDLRGERPSAQVTADWLHGRQPRLVTGEHWGAIDAHERGLGAPALRPRVKLTRVAELLAVAHGA